MCLSHVKFKKTADAVDVMLHDITMRVVGVFEVRPASVSRYMSKIQQSSYVSSLAPKTTGCGGHNMFRT